MSGKLLDPRKIFLPLKKKTQNEMIWAHNKINRTGKDDTTGHGARREKERQTEKEMG